MGTCFTTLVPRYESPPTRGWFSVTLDIRTSPQPLRLGRNPSKLRKHFDRLSWRSTRRCRTNVPFLRALLVKPHQNGSSLEVKRWRWEWREVIANKNVNRTKRLRSVSSLYANRGAEMEPMPLIGIETNRELTECRKLCTSQVQVSCPPPARSLGPPLLTMCYTVSPVVLAQTVYSLLHASYSCLERTI